MGVSHVSLALFTKRSCRFIRYALVLPVFALAAISANTLASRCFLHIHSRLDHSSVEHHRAPPRMAGSADLGGMGRGRHVLLTDLAHQVATIYFAGLAATHRMRRYRPAADHRHISTQEHYTGDLTEATCLCILTLLQENG